GVRRPETGWGRRRLGTGADPDFHDLYTDQRDDPRLGRDACLWHAGAVLCSSCGNGNSCCLASAARDGSHGRNVRRDDGVAEYRARAGLAALGTRPVSGSRAGRDAGDPVADGQFGLVDNRFYGGGGGHGDLVPDTAWGGLFAPHALVARGHARRGDDYARRYGSRNLWGLRGHRSRPLRRSLDFSLAASL